MPIKFGSSFEWAFRRALFLLLLLVVYLLVGALLLSTFAKLEQSKRAAAFCNKNRRGAAQKARRLDFERTELLNTLWAESLAARSESDWSQVANAKLDAYERLVTTTTTTSIAGGGGNACQLITSQQWDLSSAFRSLLLLLGTIGGGPLTDQVPDHLGPATKLFAMFYALIGIPLLLIYLEHSVTALTSLVEANCQRPHNKRPALLLAIGFGMAFAALVLDIAMDANGGGEEGGPFLDSLYTVFMAFWTVNGSQLYRKLPTIVLFPLLLLLLTLAGSLLHILHTALQRWLAPHEFAFANGLCGKIEKAVSGVGLDQLQDSDEETLPTIPAKLTLLENCQQNNIDGNSVPPAPFDDGEEPASTPTVMFQLHAHKSIETIEEEEEEEGATAGT